MDNNIYKSKYISSATTTTIGTQPSGVFHSIVIGETSAGSITISDSVGTITVLKASIVEGEYKFDAAYTGSLSVITAGNTKCTVLWK